MDILLNVIFLYALIYISIFDSLTFRIPDPAVIAVALAGFAQALLSDTLIPAFGGALLGGALTFGVRWAYHQLRHVHGLGLGDVKAAAAFGLWLGPEPTLVMLGLASFLGILWALLLHVRSHPSAHGRQTRIAFGPWLAIATFLVWACPSFMDSIAR